MMKRVIAPLAALIVYNLISCGSVPSRQISPAQAAADTTAATPTATAADGSAATTATPTAAATSCATTQLSAVPATLYPAAASPDPVADLCISAFAAAGIPVPAGIATKTLLGGVSVLGIGTGVADLVTTPVPILTVVKSVNVLSTAQLTLLNRNAFYCFVDTVNVLSHMVVQRACSAQFTGFGINIDILSLSNYHNGVNVNVLSNVVELPCIP